MGLLIKRPATVVMAQVLLTLTAIAYLVSPFFVFFYMADTLGYYGISVAEGRRPLVTVFILRTPFLLLTLCIAGVATWGLIKGNRVGRVLTCGVFAWVLSTLVLDVLWSDDDMRISTYFVGFPQWLDFAIKLGVSGIYGFFIYRLGFGPREMVYFDRFRVYGYADPPPPPSFEE